MLCIRINLKEPFSKASKIKSISPEDKDSKKPWNAVKFSKPQLCSVTATSACILISAGFPAVCRGKKLFGADREKPSKTSPY